jgi:plasmid maintenance system killer protein
MDCGPVQCASLFARYSIWVSGNSRITFSFEGKVAAEGNYEDYH